MLQLRSPSHMTHSKECVICMGILLADYYYKPYISDEALWKNVCFSMIKIPISHYKALRQKNPLGKRRLNPRGNKRRLEKIRFLCYQVQRTQKHVVLFLDSTLQTS